MTRFSILALACTTSLHAFTPVLSRIDPPGGQAGTEVSVTFHGDRLDETTGALFYETGLDLTNLDTKDPKKAVAKLKIAADAAPGEHSLRLAGPGGVTELRSFWVGAFPTVDEVEPNPPDKAQRIELNRTVHGIAGNEDDDCFVVTLKKGQRLSAEVEAMRLGRTMFDASLTVLDARGFEVATCDDAPLLRTDAFVSLLAPEDGDYRVVVREAAYQGNDDCRYRLHIGTFPRPSAVFPTGGKPGETLGFTFTGDPMGPIHRSIQLPPEARSSFPVFPEQDGQSAPSPHVVTVSPLPSARDGKPDEVVRLPEPPCAAEGVLDAKSDTDRFVFSAKKGQNLDIRVIARANRSPLDAVVSIHEAKGKYLAGNDDQGGPDSLLAWTCPADGDYRIQIRDQLKRTGDDFTYRVEIAGKTPSLGANLPVVERVNSQKWKTFVIPKGGRYAAVVNVTRENLSADAVFEAASLPPGVTLHAPRIPRGVSSFPIVLEANADAPVGAGLHPFRIRSEGADPPVSGSLTDTIHHVDINNQGAYHSASFDRVPVAVTNEAPFRIELEQPRVPIVKNGNLKMRIRVERKEGYDKKVTARFLWHPPGLSGPNNIDIPGDKTTAEYDLHANGDASTGDWEVVVLGEADSGRGPVLVSSALVPLKVAEPYVTMSLDLAAAEVGKPSAVVGKIETLEPFEGAATASLSGLPYGVTAATRTITANQAEVTFPIEVAADARPGKHGGLLCIVEVPAQGGTIHHQAASGGTLRIDKPAAPPPKKEAPQEKKQAAKPEAEAAKPLSRLEQLRQRKP